jgi:YesN/AraC family two-component response regulator
MEMNIDIDKITDYISVNHSNPFLTISIAAKDLGIHKSKISIIMKSSLKITFKEYLFETRIKKLRQLILKSNFPLKDIYRRVGLPDPVWPATTKDKYI